MSLVGFTQAARKRLSSPCGFAGGDKLGLKRASRASAGTRFADDLAGTMRQTLDSAPNFNNI
jgi:hypothetical protein